MPKMSEKLSKRLAKGYGKESPKHHQKMIQCKKCGDYKPNKLQYWVAGSDSHVCRVCLKSRKTHEDYLTSLREKLIKAGRAPDITSAALPSNYQAILVPPVKPKP